MKSVISTLGVGLLTIAFCTPVDAGWNAGVAKIKITPESPLWMSGYASRNQPAQGTLHDLWAKALVLEDSQGAKGVLITLDLVGIDRETSQAICKQIQEKHDLPRASIAICTSHTHTGPVVGLNLRAMYRDRLQPAQIKAIDKYTQQLIKKVGEVVSNAISKSGPATLSYGTGEATFAVNRRNNRELDILTLRKEENLRGPVNHDVPVLVARNAKGEIIAITTGYACHATVLSFYQWSGDWPGFAQIEIEKDFPGAIALFWAGCGADQNPLPRRKVELAQKYGRQLADAVKKVVHSNLKHLEDGLKTHYREIKLPLAELPTVDELQNQTQSQNIYIVSRAKMLLEKIKKNGQLDSTYSYPIQLWNFGDELSFALLGGEVVVDYSIILKDRWPKSKDSLWVAACANDVMAYIPSRRVLKEGGYEGNTSMIYYGMPTTWAPEIESIILNALLKLADSID